MEFATFNLTKFAASLDKKINLTLWIRTNETQRKLRLLAKELRAPVEELVVTAAGRGGGTLVHPSVAIMFAERMGVPPPCRQDALKDHPEVPEWFINACSSACLYSPRDITQLWEDVSSLDIGTEKCRPLFEAAVKRALWLYPGTKPSMVTRRFRDIEGFARLLPRPAAPAAPAPQVPTASPPPHPVVEA